MKPQHSFKKGITLVEVVFGALLVVIVSVAARAVLNILNDFQQQWAFANVHHAIQMQLYQISREIRNCSDVRVISPLRIEITSFDFKKYGFDFGTNPNLLFSNTNKGLITYEYNPAEGYLERTERFPAGTGVLHTQKLLANLLLPPSTEKPMFDTVPTSLPIPAPTPHMTVTISFSTGKGFWRDKPRNYKITVNRRAAAE